MPFSCLCEGLSPSSGELGSEILKCEFHTIEKHRLSRGRYSTCPRQLLRLMVGKVDNVEGFRL